MSQLFVDRRFRVISLCQAQAKGLTVSDEDQRYLRHVADTYPAGYARILAHIDEVYRELRLVRAAGLPARPPTPPRPAGPSHAFDQCPTPVFDIFRPRDHAVPAPPRFRPVWREQ
jgi:hypothetical protein